MNKPWAKRAMLRRKRTAKAMRKKRLLADAKKNSYFPPYYEDTKRGCLKRVQAGNRYWKQYSNRCVRRAEELPSRGNGYRKTFDYQWKIF